MMVPAFIRGFRLIFWQSFKDLLLSKKAILFLSGSLLYALIVALILYRVGDQRSNDDPFAFITFGVMWQALLPLTATYFAIAAIREEIASRTLVFLISEPVPRAAIWLGKFAAASAAATLILFVGYGAACVAARTVGGGEDSFYRIADSTLEAPWLPIVAGVPAYCAVGSLLALWFKRPMIAGAVFVLGWEELVGSTPGQAGVRNLTVLDSVRTIFYHRVPAAEQFQRQQRMFGGGGDRNYTMPSAEAAFETLCWLTAISLTLALLVGARRDYDSAPKE